MLPLISPLAGCPSLHMVDDTSRSTRSRTNSLSMEGNASVLDFSKPCTIDSPGCYRLSNSESCCTISLFCDVLPKTQCESIISEIEALGALKQYTTLHRNQNMLLPRLSAWYGPIDYAYSGVVMKGNPVSDSPRVISAYQNIARNILEPNGIAQTSDCFLVNQYRNGRDSCGEHSDDEPEVDRFSPIITLSLGQQRFMLIRELGKSGNAVAVKLNPGSVLVMNGDNFQAKYTHQIPKDNVCSKPRTSITFRTCNADFLASRNALSTSLIDISCPPTSTSTLKSPLVSSSPCSQNPSYSRRGSLSFALPGKNDSDIDCASSAPSSPAPSVSSMASSRPADSDFPPLSLEIMCEAIDVIKEKSVRSELSRYGLSTSGSITDCKKRLKKAVKNSFQQLASNLLLPRNYASDPEYVIAAIETLESSIIDLQAKISTQNSVLQTLAISNDNKEKKPMSPKFTEEMNNFDKRLEKIEELMSTINAEQEKSSSMLAGLKPSIDLINSNTTETKERVRSTQLPNSSNQRNARPKKTPTQSASRSSGAGPPGSARVPQRRKRKVLLLHDSQLNDFAPDSFSKAFSMEKYKAGSYADLSSKHMRNVISKPGIDAYILQLGVNDYRYCNTEASLHKAVEDTKGCIKKLLESSSAKIVVSLPTPTPGSSTIEERTKEYVKQVSEFITVTRQSDSTWRRLFTINNLGSFSKVIEKLSSSSNATSPLKEDQLHVSEYGLKKLCLNIKYGLYRAFGMKHPKKQAPAEP